MSTAIHPAKLDALAAALGSTTSYDGDPEGPDYWYALASTAATFFGFELRAVTPTTDPAPAATLSREALRELIREECELAWERGVRDGREFDQAANPYRKA